MDLNIKKCVPCEEGGLPLSMDETQKYMAEISGWEFLGEKKIKKEYQYKDFKEAMVFVNKVADIAEDEGHHPDIHIFWNKVQIELWTHTVGGLSENDFIVATKIDAV